MHSEAKKELLGYLDSIENKCAIVRILLSVKRDELIPTALEDMLEDAQVLVDDFCVEKVRRWPLF